MPRILFAVPLTLGLLAGLTPGSALAGPPEGPSGRIVLAPDEIADTLRKYRVAKDEGKRRELLDKIASTRDPRVAVALGEALGDSSRDVRYLAAYGIVYDQTGWNILREPNGPLAIEWASKWWKENEADLRRRAKALPR
jgi:hypothetical protein